MDPNVFIGVRENQGMKRRTLLAAVGTGAVALAGCTALGKSADESRPGYLGQEPIVYYRDDLTLSLRDQPVHRGDTVEFEATNTGNSDISLGCRNPWALQYQTDNGWEHVTWTGGRFYLLCLSSLPPGESVTEEVPLSREKMAAREDISTVQRPLRPGAYRFTLVGPTPYLALQFNLVES